MTVLVQPRPASTEARAIQFGQSAPFPGHRSCDHWIDGLRRAGL